MAVKLTNARVKAGRLIPVYNTERKKFSRASVKYFALWVEDANGKNERCLLLTEADIAKMEKRASKNGSDVPMKGRMVDLLD